MTQAVTKKKRIWLRMLLVLVVVMAAFGITVGVVSLYASSATTGNTIAQYSNPRSALLVLDVQYDTTNNNDLYGDTTEFIENVNHAIALAEAGGLEIIYIKSITGKNPIILMLMMGRYREGSDGAELDSRLRVVNQNIFAKEISDAFSSDELESFLILREVDTLYIVGADAAGCVYRTAQGGLNRSYRVTIIEEAVITFDDKTMEDMLKKYVSDGIEVISLEEFREVAAG